MLTIQENISLLPYNTLRIEAKARYFVEIDSLEALQQFFVHPLSNEKLFILGGGSNTLFTKDFEGLVLKISLKGIQELSDFSAPWKVFLKVHAGEERDHFVEYCCKKGYAGIENLAGIPGQVGTSPVSNIGAYGMEVQNSIFSVEGYDLVNKEIKTFSHEECQFEYRGSIFKNHLKSHFLVTAVTFALQENTESYEYNLNYPDLQKYLEGKKIQKSDLTLSFVSEMIRTIRNHKLPNPDEIGTAGSFFANPMIDRSDLSSLLEKFPELKYYPCENEEKIKLSAGQLIDLTGMKGFQLGNAGVSPKHALVLIHEQGDAEDLLKVAQLVQEAVLKKFGVFLHPEVVYVE